MKMREDLIQLQMGLSDESLELMEEYNHRIEVDFKLMFCSLSRLLTWVKFHAVFENSIRKYEKCWHSISTN